MGEALLGGKRLRCWVGEIDDGCREGSSARWEKTVLLVGKNVVAAALPYRTKESISYKKKHNDLELESKECVFA